MSAATQFLPAATHAAPLIFGVDDEPVFAGIVGEPLQMEGYRICVFHDSKTAVEALSNSPVKPDLLLADFKMPGLNGLELLARGKSPIRSLKTIRISGMASELILGEHGFHPDLCVSKPFPVATLLKSVRRTLVSAD